MAEHLYPAPTLVLVARPMIPAPGVVRVDGPERVARGGYGMGRHAPYVLQAGDHSSPDLPGNSLGGRAALRQTGDFHREAARLFADTLAAAAILAQDAPPLTQVTLHALTDVYLQGMLALLSQGPAPTAGDGEASGATPLLVDDLTDRLVSFSAAYLDRIRVLCCEGE